MVDRENREDWRRELALLALGKAVRGEDEPDASPGSLGDRPASSWREDAVTRHRIARSQRDAWANPLPASSPEPARFRSDGELGPAASTWPEPDDAARYPRATTREEPVRSAEEGRPTVEDKAYLAPPPVAPPLATPPPATPSAPPPAVAASAPAAGLFRGLLSAIRKVMPGRRTSRQTEAGSAQPAISAVDEQARQVQDPVGHRQPDFRPAVRHAYPYDEQVPYEQLPASSQSQPEQLPASTSEAPQDPDDRQRQIDEIRASLREFREAVRDLAESRSRRRFF